VKDPTIAIIILLVLLFFAVRWFFRARDYAARGIADSVLTFIDKEVERQMTVKALTGDPVRFLTAKDSRKPPAGMVMEYRGKCVVCNLGTNGKTFEEGIGEIPTCEDCYRSGDLFHWIQDRKAEIKGEE
jgi:hypothetical protein